ncbi:alpha/beta hydrolase [Octadecabacter sp. G9-8]|uniref:Alpha/beta hydrolase n=1 Tax=Octadecabacter dasysiphoniae TaxID=2909341 RepID=A0ABS9D0M4_9RHOB|nr:alpha/beta hydrolase [Octadecabacter dasysiphoniae]MCF2872159.1 alpha/beta hydrolase [Octadecabacter dasysiphoniae]
MMQRRAFLATSAAALMSGCMARGQFTPPLASTAFDMQPILMATNRASPQSSERIEGVNFYDLDIAVPRNRAPGDVPVKGADAFALIRERQLSSDAELKRALGPAGRDPLVIWVHGFNNTAAEAVYRQAQMVQDTGLRGPQMSFVWPSAATTRGYLFDRDSALQARTSLEELFLRLGRIWGGPVTVIAHSLGCLLAMEALVRMRLQNRPVVLDSLVLLQPDIAPDVFDTQVADISPLPKNALLVVSGNDPALRVSALVSQSTNRVGAAANVDKYEAQGFRVVDLSGIQDAGNSHLVALTSPTVLQFLRELST